MKRVLLRILWLMGGVFVLFTAVTTWYVYRSLRPTRWMLRTTPAQAGIAYENVRFPSRDGTPLVGWWAPAPKARGTIILCHGYPANRSDVEPMIPFLHRAGYNVLAFDFRRLGESGGDTCTIGIREPEDLKGAVDYAVTRSRAPIGALGISMGAAVCVMAAADEPRIRAVVADSPYTSLSTQVRRHFGGSALSQPVSAYAAWLGGRVLGCSLSVASPLRAVARLAPRPLLLIHGTADRLIPYSDSEALYAAAGLPKSLWLAPGSRHVQAFEDHQAEYQRRVLAFFREAFRAR